jgi:hypothetical protein
MKWLFSDTGMKPRLNPAKKAAGVVSPFAEMLVGSGEIILESMNRLDLGKISNNGGKESALP